MEKLSVKKLAYLSVLFRAVPRSLRSSGTGVRFSAIPRRVFKWCTRTRLRKVLSSILAILIGLTSIRFIFFPAKKVRAADVLIGLNEGYGSSANDTNSTVSAGTITNAVWKTEDLCKVGKCLYFDGTGDYVSYGDNANLDMAASDNVTVEAWFRTPDITSGTRSLISKYETAGGDGGYRIYINSSGQIVFGIDSNNTSFPEYSVTSSSAYDDNKWHHVAAVKSGTSSMTLFIDAQTVGTTSIASTAADNGDSFFIGRFESDTSQDFSGFIDEVKVLRTARSATEVKADYTGETPSRGTSAAFGPDQSYLSNGLVGYWKLDETTNGAARTDYSGNGFTLVDNNSVATASGKFANGGEFVPGSSQYLSYASTISGIKTVSFWVNPDALTNYFVNLTASVNIQSNSSGVVSANGFTNPKIFVNGVQNGVLTASVWSLVTVTSDTATNADTFYVGKISTNYFDGTMDNVRVYNRALSPAEVQDLYNWAPGPVGYWDMNDNTGQSISDKSTAGNSATLGTTTGVEATDPSWSTGRIGSSLFYADTSRCSEIDDGAGTWEFGEGGLDAGTNDFTITAWVLLNSSVTDAIPSIYSKGAGSDTSVGYWFYYDTADNRLETRISDGGAGDRTSLFANSFTLDDNSWHHVAIAVDRETTTDTGYYYIDGVPYGTPSDTADAGTNINTTSEVHFGTSASCTGVASWEGNLDEMRIYPYVRTSKQIIEDMNAGHPAPGSPVGSPIIWWKLDDGYGDTANNSGNGGSTDNGNLSGVTACPGGASCPSWTNSGKFGKALSFDGGDYFEVTSNSGLNPSDVSISAWINTSTSHTDNDIISKTGGSGAFPYTLRIVNNKARFIISDGTYSPYVDSTTSTNTGNWKLITGVRDAISDKLYIYINGILENSTTDTTTGSTSNVTNLNVGQRANATARYTGVLDEVQVYGLALTSDQIKVLYNQASSAVWGATSTTTSGTADWSNSREYCPPGNTETNCAAGQNPAPVAEWKMDENTGTTLQDTSGNGNTSTTWTGDTKYTPGIYSSGLQFDNDNDVVRIAESSTTDLGATTDSYTVSAWFKTSDPAAGITDGIVEKHGINTGAHPFKLTLVSRQLSFSCSDGTTSCGSQGTTDLNDGKWHYVAGVRDATADKTYAYVDGVFVDSDADNTTAALSNNYDISIGNGRDSYLTDDFNGSIDQVRIYNYARTQAQIAWEFNHGKPMGWWKLDDNVSGNGLAIGDSSNLGNNGTTANGGTNLDCTVSGKRNKACDLDGTDDSINMGNLAIYNYVMKDGNDFSVAGWFNRDTFTTDDTIFGKRASQDNGNQGWLIWIDDSTDKLTLEVCDANATCDEYQIESASTFTSTGWNHFVVVWDDDSELNTTIYINGIAENVNRTGTFANIGNIIDPSATGNSRNLRIGAESGGTTNNFDGKLDDIMFFSYALNAQQLKLIYNEGSTVRFGPDSGPP